MADRGSIRDYSSGLRADRGPDERWLTVYEAAAMTLQHPDTVRRWIAEGRLQAEDRGRMGLRVRESDVEQYVNEVFRSDIGRSPADKGLSSNLVGYVQSDALPNEVERAGAGWPFHNRGGDALGHERD